MGLHVYMCVGVLIARWIQSQQQSNCASLPLTLLLPLSIPPTGVLPRLPRDLGGREPLGVPGQGGDGKCLYRSVGLVIGVGIFGRLSQPSKPASFNTQTHTHIPTLPPKQALLLLPPTAHNLALFEAWHACRDPPERFLPLLGAYVSSYVCIFVY